MRICQTTYIRPPSAIVVRAEAILRQRLCDFCKGSVVRLKGHNLGTPRSSHCCWTSRYESFRCWRSPSPGERPQPLSLSWSAAF